MFAVPNRSKEAAAGFDTDVRQRTQLSTASNALRAPGGWPGGDDDGAELSSAEYFAAVEEEIGRAIDRDVEAMITGMEEIVHLAAAGDADRARSSQDALTVSFRAETVIRSCTHLLGLSHSLKMLWLLGDEGRVRAVRDAKRAGLLREIAALKAQVAAAMDELKK